MYWDTHRLLDPTGRVIRVGKGPNVEDYFARLIEREGYPVKGSYTMRCTWVTDGRWCPAGHEITATVLGCDETGWWQLDSSKVPATSGRARFMHEQPARIQREYGGSH